MTKLLEEMIAKMRALPEEDQDVLAALLLAANIAKLTQPLGKGS